MINVKVMFQGGIKMRRDNKNKSNNEKGESNQAIYISISILTVAIVAFVVSFIFYGNYADNNFEIGRTDTNNNLNRIQEGTNYLDERIELQTAETSSSLGKSVNEIENNSIKTKQTENIEEINKIAVNTSAKEAKREEEKRQEEVKQKVEEKKKETNTPAQEAEVETTNVEEKVENPTFEMPVKGEIMKEYAKDNLVYSDTLKEWTTHNGIDIKAEKTTVVNTSAEGKVKAIKNDPRYGITVIVEHANGFQTVYANLLSTEFVVEGEELEKGQAIGTIGNTATFEIADDAHLHFEILKDGEYLDPELYITN